MAPGKAEDSMDNDDVPTSTSLAQSRSRRQHFDKTGRTAAFERLRKAKEQGVKNKYVIDEEKKVYDVVNENEYSDIVRQRQEDDWIVDDDGAGYVEDGREIFDDDMDDDAVNEGAGKTKDGPRKKNKNIMKPGTKPKKDIKTMFAAAAANSKKKSEKDVTLAGDDLLGDIMQELHGHSKGSAFTLSKSATLSKALSSPSTPGTKKNVNPFLTKISNLPQSGSAPPVHPTVVALPPERKKFKSAFHLDTAMPHLMPKFSNKREINVTVQEPETTIKKEPLEEEMCGIGFVHSQPVKSEPTSTDLADAEMDIYFDEDDNDLMVKMESPADDSTTQSQPAAIVSKEIAGKWINIQGEENSLQTSEEIQVDPEHLPVVVGADGKQVMQFYWLDAFEDPFKQPGTVYLFGKVWIEAAETFVSCCVTVKNIDRKIYLLPRPTKVDIKTAADTGVPVNMMDVYTEFNEKVTEKYKIVNFKSKKVTKKYAFEKNDVPLESDYLEVHYSADLPILPLDLQGETFSHVFGTNTTSLEHLLLDRKMKGPGWLDLLNVQPCSPPISWCKLEAIVSSPKNIQVHIGSLASPPLVIMTLNLRTLPNSKSHQNEVIGAAGLIHNNFFMDRPAPVPLFQQHFAVISRPSDCIFPFDLQEKLKRESERMKVEMLTTERALLGFLLAKIHKIDPDVIVGHDIYGFDLDVLLHRISANKILHWSKIGRLKRNIMPKISGGFGRATMAEKSVACGRLLCDVKISAQELIRCKSYDLTELVSHLLHEQNTCLDYDEIRDMYSSSQQLLKLIELMLIDSTYIMKILAELNVVPLSLQITNICGNIMGRTLMGGRSERNEYLLLHAFTEKNYICPDKEYKRKHKPVENDEEDEDLTVATKGQQGRRKPAYTGGLVLEPKKGFYDKFILLLDFNSLYPSIIQEYNICFTTINRTHRSQHGPEEEEEDLSLILPSSDLEPGILPTEIRKLVESRRLVKQLMKEPNLTPEQTMQYDIRQKALKLTANSMYGCLGFTFSRFYAKPLAALVTGKGREILMKTKELVEGMGLEVIYGDTDSIMVNTNTTDLEQVFKLGNKVKAEVNKLYRLLEIDIDGVFKSMLLLKKKKYAALSVVRSPDGTYHTSQEMKGLDIVRRDWCDLAKEAGNFVVSQILSGQPRETVVENIHTRLIEVGEKVRNGEVPVEFFYITKQLAKNPEDYPDKKSQSHVQVALRMNSKGGKKMRAGDTVAYVICIDGSNLSSSQRAYHPDELAKNSTLKLDVQYYLAHQLHPVVSRLCDPIEGTDAAHIAECLGLDPSGYRHNQSRFGNTDEEDALLAAQMTEEEKYRDCERFKFICPSENCQKENIIDGVFTMSVTEGDSKNTLIQTLMLGKCQNPKCKVFPYENIDYLQNHLVQCIRAHISKYYAGWLKCEDSACGSRTRRLPLIFQRGHPVCTACHHGFLHQEYSESDLYTQLLFYQHIFDLDKVKMTTHDKVNTAYNSLKNTVKKWLQYNAFSQVNLDQLFKGLFVLKQEK